MLFDRRALALVSTAPALWWSAVVFKIVSAALGVTAAVLTGYAVVADTAAGIGVYLTTATLAVLTHFLLGAAGSRVLAAFSSRVATELRVRLVSHQLQFGSTIGAHARSGAAGHTIVESPDAVAAYVAEYIAQLVTVAVIVPVGALVLIVTVPGGFWAAVCVVGGTVLSLTAQTLWKRVTRNAGERSWRAQAEYASDTTEALAGMDTLIDVGGVDIMGTRLEESADRIRRASQHDLTVSLGSWTVTTLMSCLASAGAICVLVLVAASGAISSLVVPAMMLTLGLSRPIAELRTRWHEGFHGLIACRSIFAALDEQPTVTDRGSDPAQTVPQHPAIRIDGLGYSYPHSPTPVLDGVTMRIPAGCVTALVGESGSGKSTVVKLLGRVSDAYTGRIVVESDSGENELRTFARAQIAESIQFVPQRPTLFADTLRGNIDPHGTHSDAEITDVCDSLGLGAVVEERGLDFHVGLGGEALSGGQRQRVVVARVLIADPPLVVLDEATSSLDGTNEARLIAEVIRRRAGRTTIVIAHRPAMIAAADHVVVMDKGAVVSEGAPEMLLRPGGALGALVQVADSGSDAAADDSPIRAFLTEASRAESLEPSRASIALPEALGTGLHGLFVALRGHVPLFVGAVAVGTLSQISQIVALVGPFAAIAGVFGGAVFGMPLAPSTWLLIAVAATIVQALSSWVENYLSHRLSFDVSYELRRRLYAALSRVLPYGLGKRSVPELVAVVLRDVERLEVFYAHTSIYVFAAVISSLLAAVTFGLASPILSAVIIVLLVMGGIIPTLVRHAARAAAAEKADAVAHLRSWVGEVLDTTSELMAYKRSDLTTQRAREESTGVGRAVQTVGSMLSLEDRLVSLWVAIVPIVAVGVFASSIVGTADAVLAIVAGAAMAISAPIEQLIRVTRHNSSVAESLSGVNRVLTARPLVDRDAAEHSGTQDEGAGAVSVRARDLHVRWPDAESDALAGMTLDVPDAGITALVGPSGGGKSTFVATLAGHLPPRAGTVSAPVTGDSGLVVVGQSPALFHGSVRDNLTLNRRGHARTDDEELWAALAFSGAEEFVDDMPDGLDSMISEKGSSLSGGQRQRLALSRALLARPKLLVLDEAASQLDLRGEAELKGALARLARTIPVLIIAHRLGSILGADRIIVFDRGSVVGTGTHDELLHSNPVYVSLVGPQMDSLNDLIPHPQFRQRAQPR